MADQQIQTQTTTTTSASTPTTTTTIIDSAASQSQPQSGPSYFPHRRGGARGRGGRYQNHRNNNDYNRNSNNNNNNNDNNEGNVAGAQDSHRIPRVYFHQSYEPVVVSDFDRMVYVPTESQTQTQPPPSSSLTPSTPSYPQSQQPHKKKNKPRPHMKAPHFRDSNNNNNNNNAATTSINTSEGSSLSRIPISIVTQQPQPFPSKKGKPKNKYHLQGLKMRNEGDNPTSTSQSKSSKPEDNIDHLQLEGHTELSSKIIMKLQTNTYECMVCYETIGRRAEIWSCTNCFSLFHFSCICTWSAKSRTVDTSTIQIPPQKALQGWRCPGCQKIQTGNPQCRCFCGKVDDPPYHPYFLPHSCGEPCLKRKNCPFHSCLELCHPGPCSPCSLLGSLMRCHCKKTEYRLNCGEDTANGRSCGNICGSKLNCEHGICKAICHSGPHPICDEKVQMDCFCGKQKNVTRLCGEGGFSCYEVCGKMLSCGNHRCEELCHTSQCKECPLLPQFNQRCPCGSTWIGDKRKSCLDVVPLCDNTCGKPLACSSLTSHRCKEKCHLGPCDPCSQLVKQHCRCTTSLLTLPCHEVYKSIQSISQSSSSSSSSSQPNVNNNNNTKIDTLTQSSIVDNVLVVTPLCDVVCKKHKSCGRHICQTKCCPSIADPTDPEGLHVCTAICNHVLKCGRHKCIMLCHKGKCMPCLNASFTELTCDCGKTAIQPPVSCGTPKPKCNLPCTKPRECGHVDVFSAFTGHTCHSGPCPPCVFLVEKWCMGQHEIRKNVKCSQAEISCGKVCGKQLPCNLHLCNRICHSGECVPNQDISLGSSKSYTVVSCGNVCGQKLPTCEHNCLAKCHPTKNCPTDKPCRQLTKIYCECKRKSSMVECLKCTDSVGLLADLTSGIYISHSKEAPTRTLACDSECEAEKRKKMLAEAFGVAYDKERDKKTMQYNETLLNLVKLHPQTVKKLETSLGDFIANGGGVGAKFNFPVMDKVHRQLIHELCKYYNLEAVSVDREPYRSVSVTKNKDSKLPPLLLSECAHLSITTQTPNLSTPSNTAKNPPTLHVYGLTSSIKTSYITSLLYQFEDLYKIQWIDDNNCLLIFDDEKVMKAALSCLNNGDFNVKMYKETPDTQQQQQQPPLQPKGAWGKEPPKSKGEKKFVPVPYNPDKMAWRKDDNSFRSLITPTSSSNQSRDLAWGGENFENPTLPILPHAKNEKPLSTTTTTTTTSSTLRNQEDIDDWTMLVDDSKE